jgi:hypothetical protein
MPWGDGEMRRGWYTDEGSAYIDIHDNVMARIEDAHWYSAWTPSIHDIQIRDNYTDAVNYLNNGTDCTMTNNTLVENDAWPQAALDIMATITLTTSTRPPARSRSIHGSISCSRSTTA